MPPVDQTPDNPSGSFELVNGLHAYDKVPIFEYRSKQTGLTVVIAEVEGPIVNGYFCLATEAFDDDGLPHTLEHLIFLGSEDHPYKGILDLLANRCLASGTNAWTDTDHTCYTMETAGSEGFLALMPIFLEHILYPVLSDEGFMTEVHHITAEGNDAGVVYCEMQGRENSAESRLYRNMARAMYPGKCGYASETGGIMKNLRETTTNELIKAYHHQYYRPENLKIIITGQVKHDEVFKALEPIEGKILQKGERTPFERPWQSPVEPLTGTNDIVIKYPTDEETNGLYSFGWRGPSAVTEQYMLTAISILMKYLTEFSTYLLPKEFVEIEDPYASQVGYNLVENSVSCFYISFEDVPVDKFDEIKPKLFTIFKQMVENEDFNMERMENILKRHKLEQLSNVENNPHDTLAFIIIGYVLYGYTKEDFTQRANPLLDLDKLLKEPKSFWIDLVRKYILEADSVSVQCLPSKAEQTRMQEEESERLRKQIDDLGEAGLKKCSKTLENAVEFNSRDPPSEMLTSIPIPSLDTINFYNITRYRSDLDQRKQIDLSETSVYTCFDDIKSEFVYAHALLDSSALPADLRVYLPLVLEALFETPIRRDGKLIPYEEVSEKLQNETIAFSAKIGLGSRAGLFKCGAFSSTICVQIQVESAKYEVGLQWLRDMIYNTVFSSERLKIIATKMMNSISQLKRSGRSIVASAMDAMRYVKNSNVHNSQIMLQHKFLMEVIERLGDEGEATKIEADCEKVWRLLVEPKNVALHLIGSIDSLNSPAVALNEFLPKEILAVQKKLNPIPDEKLMSDEVSELNGLLISMGCLESSFFFQTTKSIRCFDDPDLPALMLYLQYLIQAEGPMWRQIRGKGFSYGYTMRLHPDEGLLYLIFARATNVIGAYEETRLILKNQLDTKKWDENLIDSAKSSLVFELIEKEKTIQSLIALSVISYFHQVDITYNRQMLGLISKVTVAELNHVGEKYLRCLFEKEEVRTAIVTDPSKAEQIEESFKGFGFNLTVYPSLEESFLNSTQ